MEDEDFGFTKRDEAVLRNVKQSDRKERRTSKVRVAGIA